MHSDVVVAWGYSGEFVVKCMLQLGLLWFCRSNELRTLEWGNVKVLDGDNQ